MSAIDLKTAQFPLRLETGDTFSMDISVLRSVWVVRGTMEIPGDSVLSGELPFRVQYPHCFPSMEVFRKWAEEAVLRRYDGFRLEGLTPELAEFFEKEAEVEKKTKQRYQAWRLARRLARSKDRSKRWLKIARKRPATNLERSEA